MHNTIIVQPGGVVNVHCSAPAAVPPGAANSAPNEIPVSEMDKVTAHKRFALAIQDQLYSMYVSFGQNQKADAIRACGHWLTFQAWADAAATKQLVSANFCKHPLCPLCSWRRSTKWSRRLALAARSLADIPGGRLYHLTLTVRNSFEISKDDIRHLKSSAVSLIRKFYNCSDYLTALEIKYSDKKGFHPHIHALLWVDRELKTDKQHIGHLRAEWGAMHNEPWLEATCYPVYDAEGSAVEVAKYLVKYDTINLSEVALWQLATSLHGVKKIQRAGVWAAALVSAKDVIKAERLSENERLSHYPTWREYYEWADGGYCSIDSASVYVVGGQGRA